MQAWTHEMQTLSPARDLSRSVLVDHLPEVLTHIAGWVDSAHRGQDVSLVNAPGIHAIDRLARGFELDEVVEEYSILRRCTFDLWEQTVGPSPELRELSRLDRALDQSMVEATVRYARARSRMLKALDRISDAALGSEDIDEFLTQLLRATLETMEASDTAAVYLKGDDHLRIRAAVGQDEDLARGRTLKIGEGFAGAVAAEGKPLFTRSAETDARVKSESIRKRGVKALYGIPLVHDGQVIGVAETGSVSANEFSEEDMLLLRTMAHRATTVIIQARLVGARRRAEAELSESEARFQALADNIPQLAWMADESGWISWYNQRWYEYTGTTLEDMQGWGWQKVHHPDHLARVVEKVRHHFETGEIWEDTFPLRGKDGRYRWFLSRAIPLRDDRGVLVKWIGTNTDVTEERFLRSATGVLAASLDFRETLASIATLAVPALADWCAVELVTEGGTTEQLAVEHIDRSKVELAHELRRRFPPDPDAPGGVAHVLRTGQPELYEDLTDTCLTQLARSPEHAAILRGLGLRSAMITPMVARGRTVGAISFISAESGRRYTPRDLDTAQELALRAALALDNARLFREAQEAARAREEILAVVSHDLRNPLSTIQMSTELLLSGTVGSNERSRWQLGVVHRAVGRMERLIGDLLDMASIQAGRLALETQVQPAEPIVVEAIELNQALAAEQGIEIERESRVGGLQVLGDRQRIMQVFSNLIGNAIKFCPPGERITVSARREDGQLHFSVSDTGPGISEQELPHIFEPYWSADRHASQGTGLGLFIAKGIIEAHGGRIWAESTVGVGSTFHFTLPLGRASADRDGASPVLP